MMRCEIFRETILDYTSGNLGPETLKAFRLHFDGCPACAEQLRAIEGQEALLKAVPAPKPPAGLWLRVQQRIADAELLHSLPLRSKIVHGIAAAAAALFLAVVAAVVLRSSAPAPAGGLDLKIVDVRDRAKAEALGRMLPRYDGTDSGAALNLVKGD